MHILVLILTHAKWAINASDLLYLFSEYLSVSVSGQLLIETGRVGGWSPVYLTLSKEHLVQGRPRLAL